MLSRRQPVPQDYSIEQHADDMLWAIEQLSWGQTFLECNSAGGPVGQWIAVKRPDLIRGLILSCTLHRTDEHARAILLYWIELAKQGKWAELNWSSIVYTFHKQLWLYRLFRPLLGLLRKPTHPERLERILSSLLYLDNRPILPRISSPTLVIAGADDRIITADIQREMAALIPDSRLILYPGYGHGNDIENPQYRKEVAHFITEVTPLFRSVAQ